MDTALRERLGEEEAGQRWAGPLGRSSCPRAEAQWKDPGLSARTFPPELPQVQPPALGGGSRGGDGGCLLGVSPSVSCRVGVIFLLPEVLRWGEGMACSPCGELKVSYLRIHSLGGIFVDWRKETPSHITRHQETE